jgi:hypothetical protein
MKTFKIRRLLFLGSFLLGLLPSSNATKADDVVGPRVGAVNGNGRNMMKGKLATRSAFVDYRAHSQFGTGSKGVYHKIDLGMIEVFLLDPRYFSQTEPSPVDETQPTCFGARFSRKALSFGKHGGRKTIHEIGVASVAGPESSGEPRRG